MTEFHFCSFDDAVGRYKCPGLKPQISEVPERRAKVRCYSGEAKAEAEAKAEVRCCSRLSRNRNFRSMWPEIPVKPNAALWGLIYRALQSVRG